MLLLAGLFALLPLALDAQVYRVDPVPSFSEVRAYEWNEQAGKADYGKRITLPADAEVRLLDTLEGHGGVLVRYEDRKVMMYPADLAWDDELNEEGMPDYITERTRLKGLGHFALHSGVSRWAHSYQPAWMIVIILLLDFYIRMCSAPQDTFRIQADRTPLQISEFSLRGHFYHFQLRIFQNGLKDLLTYQSVLRHHLKEHIIYGIQLPRLLPDSGIIAQTPFSFHKYNMIKFGY